LGSGDFLFDVGSQGGLIVFDGQQIMAPRFQDDRAGGLILRVQGLHTDQPARQVQGRDQFLWRHGHLMGLLIHQRAAKIVLTWRGDRRENGSPAAMMGFLAIHHD
jgi:hypothetical protein